MKTLIALVIMLVAITAYAVYEKDSAIEQPTVKPGVVTTFKADTVKKQITVDGTELQGGHYFAR